MVGIGTPTHGSSAAILDSLNLTDDRGAGVLGQHTRSATSPPATTAPTGQPIHGAVEDRILGVTLEDLVAIPHVIGVAHGRAKVPGVLGALRGHLIDSLVCDEALARHLLSEARSASASDNGGS